MFGFNKIKQAQKEVKVDKELEKLSVNTKAQVSPKENIARDKQLIEAEKVFREGVVSVRDIIAPAALKVDPHYLRLNNLYVRTLFVMTYPRYVTIGWFAPIPTVLPFIEAIFLIQSGTTPKTVPAEKVPIATRI